MDRRRYLALGGALLTQGVAGCGSADEDPGDVEGTYLEAESHPEVDVETHSFEDTGTSDHPWAVVGTVSHTIGRWETLQVRVTFFDADDGVITDNDVLVRNLASEQSDEFTVRFDAGRPERVATYELIVDIP